MRSHAADFLRAMFVPGDIFEVRVPKCREHRDKDVVSTVSGYFTYESIDQAVTAIEAIDRSALAPGIYVTINPVQQALLARAANRLKPKAKATTADTDIVARRRFLIDCDPVRPSGVSSTDAELQCSATTAGAICEFLTSKGFPLPMRIMSGNGHHLIYAIDLPRDDGGLVQRVLDGIASRFDDEHVKIDRGVHNAARITKIPGTTARKGDDLRGIAGVEQRPHRRATILDIPPSIVAVTREQLEAVASAVSTTFTTPSRTVPSSGNSGDRFARFECTPAGVRGYLESHAVKIVRERVKGDCTFLDLEACPLTGVESSDTEISVMVSSSGRISFHNFHNRGAGLEWVDVRERLEPGYRAYREAERHASSTAGSGVINSVEEMWQPPLKLQPEPMPFPIESAFPPQLAEMRDYALAISEAIQVPVDVPVMLMHPAAGYCLSHVARVELNESWRQNPAHYNAILLDPANRKTDPFKLVMAPIQEWEQRAVEEARPKIAEQQVEIATMKRRIERLMDLASGKAAPRAKFNEPVGDQAKRDAQRLQVELAQIRIIHEPQAISGDITPEALARVLVQNNERLGVFSDESEAIDIMLGRYSDQPNLQLYNKAYDASPHRINRAGSPTLHLRRPLLSIGFVIQPEAVRDLLANRKAKGTGAIARFGMSLPESWLGRRKLNPQPVPEALRLRWHRVVGHLLDEPVSNEREPLVVTLSSDARRIFDEFRAEIETELGWCGEFNAYGFQDWGGKLCGKIGRIACTLHGMLFGAGKIPSLATPISKETMLAALNQAPYLISHTKSVMAFTGFDESFNTARRILAWVAREALDRFSAKQCLDHVRNSVVTKAEQIASALEVLAQFNYVRPLNSDAVPHRGRPASQEFTLNPVWDRTMP